MVAPKKVSNIGKEKEDVKSKSPSPEPFQEPDGMTTIDLNKSDDYSKESEAENAELKKRAQIKYLAQLLFALGSIFVLVLLIIMMTFLNKEYHLFTVIPLNINHSHPSTNVRTSSSTEEFLNLTRILNQEKFRQRLQSGKYIQDFPLEMDLCKHFKSINFCCDMFKNSDLQELSEFCTVNDMLNYLIETEIESRENQLVYDNYPQDEWSSNIDKSDRNINKEPDILPENDYKRSKRQFHYDSFHGPIPHPYTRMDSNSDSEVDQQQYVDPYNDFNQYQPPEQYQPPQQYLRPDQYLPLDQYHSSSQYHLTEQQRPLEQYPQPDYVHLPKQYQSTEHQGYYLQAAHIPKIEKNPTTSNIKPAQQTPLSQRIDNIYQFPENVISEIERSHPNIPLPNLKTHQAKKLPYIPKTIDQFETFGMAQQLEGYIDAQFPHQNHQALNDKNAHNKNSHKVLESNKTNPLDIDDVAPTLQSIMVPLPDHAREDIWHHVTVAPKIEHVYKSSEFQQGDHFNENHQGSDDFGEFELGYPGRLSQDDGRSNINYGLHVDSNGKFHIDRNLNSPKTSPEAKNFESGESKVSTDIGTRKPIEEIKPGLLGSLLEGDVNKANPRDETINEKSKLSIESVLPDLDHNILNQYEAPDSNLERTYHLNSANVDLEALTTIKHSTSKLVNTPRTNSKNSEVSTTPSINYTTTTSNDSYIKQLASDAQNPVTPKADSLEELSNESVYRAENINIAETATEALEALTKETIEDARNRYFSRSNNAQDVFRGKEKQDSFTATEDMQSNQQSYINPCFNPYMSPYIPFMPSAMPPAKVGSTQEPGFLKVVSVSQPQVQGQPMYVLNPSMFYGIPSTAHSTYPSLTQNPFLPQGYFPQASQSPYGGAYSSPVQVASPGGQYYMCNPIPTPTNNIAGLAGVEVRRDASNLQILMEDMEELGTNNKSREASTIICPLGEQACFDNIKCIKNHNVCDSEVHCEDSSDEIDCTCKDRVGKLRLCDGYCDCPTCEDEQGCFGCEEDEYSCDDWSRFRRSTCVPITQRCDGIKQCEITGKDEMDCSILTDHIGNFPLNKISNAVGFLHRNYKGRWYPTCFGTELWAAQVCQVEAGPSAIIPKAHMTLTTDPYNGLFINILPNNQVSLVNTCVQDRAAFVECPPIYCGLRFLVSNPYRMHEVDTSIEDMLNDLERAYNLKETNMRSNTELNIEEDINPLIASGSDDHNHRKARFTDLRNKDELKEAHLEEIIENLERTFKRREISKNDSLDVLQQSRVVGGKPSQPAAWPWLVSIYKNGIFHCGGVLINELWIVTASHCVDRYWLYYYEIQAGALRRFSYSPMDQRRWAIVIVPHEFYSKSNLRNDIAIMKLSAPVRYNKYVRPICLPSEVTAGQDFLKGPSPGTICTTVGWGATVEHGADPDHMREVEVPILQHCKHKEDSDIEEICAGLTDGGKDACQGDSGGPLMCRNPNNPNQWYLAGVVSHGEGCARPNEPGVYTKVSRYMGWIAENTREDKFRVTAPLQKCPGFVCKGTGRCVPKKRRCDRIIDCLLGDDEINCEDHFKQLFKHSRKSMMPIHRNLQPTNDFTNDDAVQNLETLEGLGIVGSRPNDTIEVHGEQSLNNINETEKESDKNLELMEAVHTTAIKEVYFKCTMMLQVISINKRCNRVIDCEDGTDELDCTCADYIRNIDPSAICDGVSDCFDLSDERDCIACNRTEYTCRLAQKCIDISKRCDGVADCPQNEDEINCASLTNGRVLSLDGDDRPMFKSRGIVSVNYLGEWKALCLNTSSMVNDQPSIATVICNMLGFDDYFSFHKYLVENGTINVTHSLSSGRISLGISEKKCNNCCEGLYISCSNTSTSSTLQYKSLEQVKELYYFPWTAAIYSNGHYKCHGTLLNQYWIVTSVKCFTGITNLQGKYLVAVFGRGKMNLPIRGPHEQIVRIVEGITVNETDIILLRLEQDVKYNRYVQAANLNIRKDGHQREKCYAIGQDNENKIKIVPLSPLKMCLVGFRCFEKKIEENCQDIHSWSGTIVCDSRSGWYPAAVFNEESGHCGIHHEKKYTSIKFYKTAISKIMVQTADPIPPPRCDGLQCNLGNCIPKEKVCDGVIDCHSGEDEKSHMCYEKEKECYTADSCVCPKTHLKCPTTHKCFPKSSFCDRTNNCGEFQDEPAVCSCRNYLTLTDPKKICDGILHCMDRSDEDPNICTCKPKDFQCGKMNKCVPQDMVCDGIKDCPNGEDEITCLSLNTKSHDRTNAGEVMTRTGGLWHAGCFNLSYSTLQLEEICYKLGFSGGSANQLTPPNNITSLTTLRPILDTFDVVWLRRQPGNKLKLRIRTGHDPYVKFVPDKRCNRLFLACI